MDADRGKVHQEVDKIVGQESGMQSFKVVIARYAIHYVEARDGDEAVMFSLRRRPDATEMEVDVIDDTDESDTQGEPSGE